jgi:hypothetical protein
MFQGKGGKRVKLREGKRKGSNGHHATPQKHSDLMTALEEIESREKTHITVALPDDLEKKVAEFLKNMGFQQREGITLLISYGLSDETDEELEKLKLERELELDRLSRTYAPVRFKTYLYSEDNRALTMNLRSMLNENRALKRALEERGMGSCFLKNEWDEWGEPTIKGFYRKYVFRNQQ